MVPAVKQACAVKIFTGLRVNYPLLSRPPMVLDASPSLQAVCKAPRRPAIATAPYSAATGMSRLPDTALATYYVAALGFNALRLAGRRVDRS